MKIRILIGMGVLINQNTFEREVLIQKGALIGMRALNLIITVIFSVVNKLSLLESLPPPMP